MKKKIINILLVSSILFNLFINSVPIVSANQISVTDEYIFGSLINASQGGRGSGGDKYNPLTERGGGQWLGGQRSSGFRLGGGPKRGDGKFAFNPSNVDINVLFEDYKTFIESQDFSSKFHVVPINQVFSRSSKSFQDENFMHGVQFNTNSPLKHSNNYLLVDKPNKKYKYVYVDANTLTSGSSSVNATVHYYTNFSSVNNGAMSNRISTFYTSGTSYAFSNYKMQYIQSSTDFHGLILAAPSSSSDTTVSWSVNQLIFSDYNDIKLDDINFIHSSENLPSKEQFIQNYSDSFNVTYDQSTNQLIKNDKYYTYNISDFTDNSIVINGNYIVVNGDYIEGSPDSIGTQLNYTSLLSKIILSLEAIPQKIADLFLKNDNEDLPEIPETDTVLNKILDSIKELPNEIKKILPDFVTEAGTNIWDFLSEIVKALSGIGQSIIDAFIDSLFFIVETLLSLVIPSTESMQQHKDKMNNTMNDLSLKLNFITEPMQSLKNVYSSPKSLFDVSFDFMGVEIYVLPEMFRPLVSSFKPILNGVSVISTFIYLYKKMQPDEVIS